MNVFHSSRYLNQNACSNAVALKWLSVACFGVRVSVTFHLIFVTYTFSSVWVADWPPFWKELSIRLGFCSRCILSFCNSCSFQFGF